MLPEIEQRLANLERDVRVGEQRSVAMEMLVEILFGMEIARHNLPADQVAQNLARNFHDLQSARFARSDFLRGDPDALAILEYATQFLEGIAAKHRQHRGPQNQ